jgi:hypothetical protein
MELTSLKGWQWGIIGVAMGSIIGFSWMSMPNDVPRSADVNEFKRTVGSTSSGARFAANKNLPVIKNVVVLPPETDPDGKLVYPVRFDRLGVNAKEETVYQAQGLYATTPFEGNQSIAQFLDARQVSYSDRTGPGQYRPVMMGAAVGLFTLGFLWPAFINFLVGAGLEKPKPREAKKVYASGPQNDGTIKDKKKAVSAKDLSELNALNDRLEASVGAGLKARDGSKADAKTVEEIVSKLVSGSGSRNTEDPTAVVPVAQSNEPKEYQGEWYPVVRPKAHKDEVK